MGKNVFWWEVEENFFFSWGKCLKESAFLMKKLTKFLIIFS